MDRLAPKIEIKPLLTYYGGKQKIASKLLKLIPEHKVYCEPFAGGAALFWAKPHIKTSNKDDYRECLNDIWGELINFYKVTQNPETFDKFLEIMEHHPHSRQLHSEYKHLDFDDHIMRAMQTYVLIMGSFSMVYKRGWKYGTKGPNHAVQFNKKINDLMQSKERILQRLHGVYIDCIDALKCIRNWDSKDTFFYVDPPYIGAEQGYEHQYTNKQYAMLCSILSKIKGKFLLSSYLNRIADGYGWHHTDIDATLSASNSKNKGGSKGSRIERVYTNYIPTEISK